MTKFVKEWGGWITFAIYTVISIAVYVSTLHSLQEQMEKNQETLEDIRGVMIEQALLNGQIIQYMKMDSQ